MTGKGSTVLWDTSLYNQAVNESRHQTAWEGPSNIISCLKKYTPEKSGHSEHQCGLSPAHHCTKAWARLYVFKDTILYLNQMAPVVLSAYISLQDNIFKDFLSPFSFFENPIKCIRNFKLYPIFDLCCILHFYLYLLLLSAELLLSASLSCCCSCLTHVLHTPAFSSNNYIFLSASFLWLLL